MAELKQILYGISDRLHLPKELLPGVPTIELAGSHALMIETHRGIGAYTEELIVIRLRRGAVSVEGSGLQLHRMDHDKMIITGKIQCVRLEGC